MGSRNLIARRALRAACAALALAAAGASPVAAWWPSGGAGSGQVPVGTLGAGATPTATAAGTSVTVSFAQTSFAGAPLGGLSGGGYAVRRYAADGGTAVAPGAGCAATISGGGALLSCREDAVPPGSWRYSVTPVLNSWSGSEGPQSPPIAVAPAAPALSAVSARNPAAGQMTGDIDVTWVAVAGATGYNLYRRAGAGSYNYAAPLNGATPLTGTSFSDPGSGLTGATSYAYVVRAVTAGIESASSGELAATTIARPVAPASVTATAAAGGQIGVAWGVVPGAAGYNVYRRTTTGAYDYGAPLNGAALATGTGYSDTATVNGSSYRYVVRAVISGAGGARVESADSPESAPALADSTGPTGVSLTDPGSPLRATVALSASASDSGSGMASVRFQRSPAGAGTWTDVCTASVAPYSCNLVTTALTDGLHDLRVIAADAAGNTTTSAVIGARRIDNTPPAVAMGDPGAFLRATVALTATASDGGSGLASLKLQRAPAGTSTWTDVCTVATGPASCPLVTTTLADGAYDLRAVATDTAGNSATSVVANRAIDNTAPTGVDIQTTNATLGVPGKPEAGDVITYTFSEPMLPASILTGWSGAATAVTVRFTNGSPDVVTIYNAANTAQLALGSVTSGKKYVTASVTFTSSSMVLSGSTIAVTLGTPSGLTALVTGTSTLAWTTSTAATDRAGNPMVAATVLETGAADLDF